MQETATFMAAAKWYNSNVIIYIHNYMLAVARFSY